MGKHLKKTGFVPILPVVAIAVTVFSLPSCADRPLVAPQEREIVEPHSKPLKPKPRLNPLGESEGISLEEFFPLQQSGDALIYDVRTPYFYRIDHIPGAINWPHTAYLDQVQERDIEIQKALNSGKKVVLYCFSLMCSEARNVAKKLARRGYDVHVFTMGIDSWRDAGLPVE
jgi:rhodanese-related sulfurtransferase